MREIIDHTVEGAGVPLRIHAIDLPGAGGANHFYEIMDDRGRAFHSVMFQKGPIQESGVNGITHEVLLAIVLDRLRSFQAGPYKCYENERASDLIEETLALLHTRTKNRVTRNVEGTSAI